MAEDKKDRAVEKDAGTRKGGADRADHLSNAHKEKGDRFEGEIGGKKVEGRLEE